MIHVSVSFPGRMGTELWTMRLRTHERAYAARRDTIAVIGHIDKAKLQMSQTHIFYPHKEKSKEASKRAKPKSITSGRKSPAKPPPLRKALH
jgi:hypothetical protein